MDVPSTTRSPTTVNTWAITALQRILTPSFVIIDIFSLVIPYFFLFALLLHNNYDCLGYHIAAMIVSMPISIYKRHGLSQILIFPLFC